MNTPFNVLFLCTGNSARSVLAEALACDPAIGRGLIRGYSAGSFPTGKVNPGALRALDRHGIAAGEWRSKKWDEFAATGAPAMDFVFTVCDAAAGEACPIWPGQPMTAHWGLPDPAGVGETEAEVDAAFDEAFAIIKRRVRAFVEQIEAGLRGPELLAAARESGKL